MIPPAELIYRPLAATGLSIDMRLYINVILHCLFLVNSHENLTELLPLTCRTAPPPTHTHTHIHSTAKQHNVMFIMQQQMATVR